MIFNRTSISTNQNLKILAPTWKIFSQGWRSPKLSYTLVTLIPSLLLTAVRQRVTDSSSSITIKILIAAVR
ncbi:MAG TPA: hypothetical protein V6D25_06890 [Leptolyngbyaceae cyanobacterium]